MKKDSIEKLFDDENLPEIEQPPKELKVLDLTPSAEALKMAEENKEKRSVEDKREFNRAQIHSNEITVSFSSGTGFARHYVENISLGGMFVRTKDRPGVGAKIPIEFAVPASDGTTKQFVLTAKVCRETETGLGLQFIDFDDRTRAELESFVQQVLPDGVSVVNRMRQSTVDRLDQLRDEKARQERERKSRFLRLVAVIVLFGVNLILGFDLVVAPVSYNFNSGERPSVTLKGQKLSVDTIRSVKRLKDGLMSVTIGRGQNTQEVIVKASELRNMPLPPTFRSAVNAALMTEPKKKQRVTQNSRRRGRP